MHMNMITEIIDKGTQFLYLLFVWNFMRSVEKWNLSPKIFFCHCLIGKKHKIFDDLRCNIPLVRLNLDRFSLVIEHDLRLRKIKIDRAALHTFFAQNRSQFLHQFKHRNQFFILSDFIFIMIFKDFFHTGITHAAVDFDHGLCDRVIDHISLRIDRHHTA